MPERILVVAHGHPDLSHGGAERAAYELFQAYRQHANVDEAWFLAVDSGQGSGALSLHAPGEYLWDQATVDHLRMRSHRSAESVRRLLDLVRVLRPTVVHLHHYYLVGADTVQALRWHFPDVTLVVTLHEFLAICRNDGQLVKTRSQELCTQPTPRNCHQCFPEVSEVDLWMRRDYLRGALETCDLVIAPSQHLADTYIAWGLDASRVHVIENAQTLLPPQPARRRASGDSSVVFGYFGQLTPFKGLDVLLQALELVPPAVRDRIELVVNGAKLESQPPAWRERLEPELRRWADAGVVRWAGPYLRANLPGRMRAVDWVVVPSVWWENSPLVIQEALGSGRPVMCSNIGGMAEKVHHDVNGWHVEVGDPRAWAEALEMAVTGELDWGRLHRGCRPGPGAAEVADQHLALFPGADRPWVELTPEPILDGEVVEPAPRGITASSFVPPLLPPLLADSGPSREELWLLKRKARESNNGSHPFSRDLPFDPELGMYDDEADSDTVLIAFAGDGDRLGIPAVEFFDLVTTPCRRVYVRRLEVPFKPHLLGADVAGVRAALTDIVASSKRAVFFGTSLGGYQALLYGTLCAAEAIAVVNATTTVRPDLLDRFGDRRWEHLDVPFDAAFLQAYGDLPTLWERTAPPPITAHYTYRNDVLRQHTEHIAEQDEVTVVPHYVREPMYQLSGDGSLAALLSSLLSAP